MGLALIGLSIALLGPAHLADLGWILAICAASTVVTSLWILPLQLRAWTTILRR
jgi:hypothetical protein